MCNYCEFAWIHWTNFCNLSPRIMVNDIWYHFHLLVSFQHNKSIQISENETIELMLMANDKNEKRKCRKIKLWRIHIERWKNDEKENEKRKERKFKCYERYFNAFMKMLTIRMIDTHTQAHTDWLEHSAEKLNKSKEKRNWNKMVFGWSYLAKWDCERFIIYCRNKLRNNKITL